MYHRQICTTLLVCGLGKAYAKSDLALAETNHAWTSLVCTMASPTQTVRFYPGQNVWSFMVECNMNCAHLQDKTRWIEEQIARLQAQLESCRGSNGQPPQAGAEASSMSSSAQVSLCRSMQDKRNSTAFADVRDGCSRSLRRQPTPTLGPRSTQVAVMSFRT